MLLRKVLFFFFFLHLVNLEIEINFHLTNFEDENNDTQHDCLNVAARIEEGYNTRQVISYCMSEWPSKFNIMENNLHQKFNFSQLSKQHVTTEQLFHWSASIDLIEEYQDYLNQLPHSDKTQLATKVFYNCTLPYFGSKCQYMFNTSYVNHSSLNDIVYDYYFYNRYEPTQFTCYMHLECNRGPSPSCLDWTEICDGKVDCLNGGLDEKDCWQLEIQQCEENEFKCSYGQCIPKSFDHDDPFSPDCLDLTDEVFDRPIFFDKDIISGNDIFSANDRFSGKDRFSDKHRFITKEPIFKYEDVSCGNIYSKRLASRTILTSSCEPQRELLLSKAMFSITPSSINNHCWQVLKCIIQMPDSLKPLLTNFFQPPKTNCSKYCETGVCNDTIKKDCPEIMYIPAYPILHGHVYLAYSKSELKYTNRPLQPTYVCYDDKYIHVPNDGKTILLPNNRTCRLYEDSKVGGSTPMEVRWLQLFVGPIGRWVHKATPLIYNNSSVYNQSIMYKCMHSSKWIPKTQVFDDVKDCYYEDDEDFSKLNNIDFIKQVPNVFRCPTTNQYILASDVNDGRTCHCKIPGDSYCADEFDGQLHFNKTISFQTICDKTRHLFPEFTGDKSETDETNCEHWPLLHVYNRCDGFWHFLNGSDEIDCDLSFVSLNCSKNSHICVSRQTKDLICLPIEKANDGIIDCIGAADEPKFCQRSNQDHLSQEFYCVNYGHPRCIAGYQLCDGKYDCYSREDEEVCQSSDLKYPIVEEGICTQNYQLYGSMIAKVLCRLFYNSASRSEIYFTFDQSSNTAKLPRYLDLPTWDDLLDPHFPEIFKSYQPHCHRGFPLQMLLDKQKNLTRDICLCPPSFYGNLCQYQNQRLSVTLQFHAPSNSSQVPFIFIISLIDDNNERIIHSYEQFNYLFAKSCERKFNFYLLYSTRPKNSEREYSIHIDIYEEITLNYRASFIKSVNYSFLPVHRLAFQFDIPDSSDNIETCSDNQCINGKCIKYFNDKNDKYFCQCYKGWSGRYCTIKYTSLCSSQSICLGKLANHRSLCVCPLNKMGPRCLINDHMCQQGTCMNGGTCIRTEENGILQKFTCICQKNFFGNRCEMDRTKLIVSFDKNSDLNSLIFIHFIEVKINYFPSHSATFKRIPVGQNSITMRWSFEFHIVFIELPDKSYYLIMMQNKYKYQPVIEKTLTSFDRCLHVNELFNETFANYSLIRRIKYYHLPCQTNLSLPCFYDEKQFCLCQQLDQQRLSNCFNFDHYSRTTCATQNYCKNGGTCFQENSPCPKYFVCQCSECYNGGRCELSTNGFSLSLDVILGVYTHPNRNIFNQERAVWISVIVSVILILGGSINGILSLITFKSKKIRESGCGLYLLNSSIIVLLIMFIFALKFMILILMQIGTITNESFLNIECKLIDFLLRLFLTMDQWLTTFVSIERAFITIKGLHFDKKKTKLVAKYTICVLLLITILTNIHDPIHRSLHKENDDNDDENKFLCIVEYKPTIRIIDYIINGFHFIVPFIINIISATIIIIIKTKQRKAVMKSVQNPRSILNEEIQQHKNLLIGPFVLIILVIPRLITTFASGCMKTTSNPWLFLLGYFISLVPPTLTFILFVLPSTLYKEEFRKAINQYRTIFQRSF